jgi:dihydroorotate dehydrogenase electron transfer subunit
MIEATVELLEVRLVGENLVGGRIPTLSRLVMKPGQYLLAHAAGLRETLPTALFPAAVGDEEIILAPSLPAAWLPGAALSLRGPFGKGFHLPAMARRIALAALDAHPYRLMPLMHQAIAQGSEIALFTSLLPDGLPAEVEILPIHALPEAANWADYLAVDLPADCLPELRQRLGLRPGQALSSLAEILVLTPMPCGGVADCGVCAVKTTRGWRYACKDGPVFDFNTLELI